MRINHNITALNTYRQYNTANSAQAKSMEKLSSGLRINSAADDAAGLAISEKMRGQIRGLDQAGRNAQDGVSLIQTAEGALSETHDILQRMRELSVQAGNDTTNDDDRGEIQKEINQLTDEVDRISNATEFNTKKLLNGDLGSARTAKAGVTEGQANLISSSNNITGATGVLTNNKVGTHEITFSTGTAGEVKSTSTNLKGNETLSSLGITDISGLAVGDKGSETALQGLNLNSTIADLANAISTQTNSTAEIVDGKLSIHQNNASATQLSIKQNTASATSATNVLFGSGSGIAYKDSDNASATNLTITDKFTDASGNVSTSIDRSGKDGTGNITYNGLTIVKEAASTITGGDKLTVQGLEAQDAKTARTENSATLQIGANENQTMSIDIEDMSASSLGLSVGGNKISVGTADDAARAITKIDKAIGTVSAERSKLGAFQNRLDHTINNLSTSSENLTASESRIRDVDYALAA
ncbi:hypothetical protein COJ01_14315 [Priestia megaterium]|uniref:flagellin N-terminal helical domain-containing protein n=1 Tax=Priestia megaterium TaxID=1404 RepID=UPI000BF3F6BA|nr:flagellin [Priestia megaterium]PFL00570.1 hypothetical protein COJ01_14315 [Priestia megaterium]